MAGRRRTPLFWACVIAGAALALGTIGPWARVLFVSFSGLEIDGGVIVLGAAVGLAVLPFAGEDERRSWPCVLALALAGLTLLYLLAFCFGVWGESGERVQAFGVEASDLVSPGWGLYLSWLAAIAAAGLYAGLLVERRRSRSDAVHPPGWYRHPDGGWRWWDGERWTQHRA